MKVITLLYITKVLIMKFSNKINYLLFAFCFVFSVAGQNSSKKALNVIWISVEDMGPVLSSY